MSRPIPDEEKEIQKSQKPSPVTGKTILIDITIQEAHPLDFATIASQSIFDIERTIGNRFLDR